MPEKDECNKLGGSWLDIANECIFYCKDVGGYIGSRTGKVYDARGNILSSIIPPKLLRAKVESMVLDKKRQLLKSEIEYYEELKKGLERNLKEIKKREEMGVKPTPPTDREEIIERLDRIEREIAKLREKERMSFEIFEKTPPSAPSVPSALAKKQEEMVVECERYSGTVMCLNRKWGKEYEKTGVVDPKWFRYYIGDIVEVRKEGISQVIINEEGRKYYLERDLVRNRWCLRDPTAQVPYVFVNEWTLVELTNIIYGYVQKGYLEYLKQCVYSYVNDPYIERVMRLANDAGSRLHADVRPIDEVMEDELTSYASEHNPTEIAFIKQFIRMYRAESEKCKALGGFGVIRK